MAATAPDTAGQRLALLLQSVGKSHTDVVDDLIIPDLASLEDLLADKRAPTPDEALLLAAYLDVPIGVLTGRIPARGSRGLALRLGTMQAPADIRAPLAYAHTMLRIQHLLRSWFPDAESLCLQRARAVRSRDGFMKKAGEVSAARLRSVLDLGEEPITDLTAVVEGLGIPVAHRPMEEGSNLTGMAVPDHLDGRQRWTIVVNSDDTWLRQRYTQAHELSHVLFEDSDDVIVEHVEVRDLAPEWRAESFARHLLVPTLALRAFWTGRAADAGDASGDGRLIGAAMMHFGVSRAVILKALVEDGMLSSERADRWSGVAVQQLMTAAGGLEWWKDGAAREGCFAPSPMLLNLALDAYHQGLIDVRVVAELLEEDPEAVRADLAERGWAPVESA